MLGSTQAPEEPMETAAKTDDQLLTECCLKWTNWDAGNSAAELCKNKESGGLQAVSLSFLVLEATCLCSLYIQDLEEPPFFFHQKQDHLLELLQDAFSPLFHSLLWTWDGDPKLAMRCAQEGWNPSVLTHSNSGRLVTYNSWAKLGIRTFDRDSPHQPCYTNRPWVISPMHSNVHVSCCQWL